MLLVSLISNLGLVVVPITCLILKNIRVISKDYIWLLMWFLACVNLELTSLILVTINSESNAGIYNLNIVIETIFLLLMYRDWGRKVKHEAQSLYIIMIVEIGLFLLLTYYGKPFEFNSILICFSAFILVLISIHQLNYYIIYKFHGLRHNPQFLISLVFLVFFLYTLIYEFFWIIIAHSGNSIEITVMTKVISALWYTLFPIRYIAVGYVVYKYLIVKRGKIIKP